LHIARLTPSPRFDGDGLAVDASPLWLQRQA
jgi:hypothetical protein